MSMPAAAAERAKVDSVSRAAIAASCSVDNRTPFGCSLRFASVAAPAVASARARFGSACVACGTASWMARSRARIVMVHPPISSKPRALLAFWSVSDSSPPRVLRSEQFFEFGQTLFNFSVRK